jgi:hypothetical protein
MIKVAKTMPAMNAAVSNKILSEKIAIAAAGTNTKML